MAGAKVLIVSVFFTINCLENDVLFKNDTGKLGKRNSECFYQESNLSLPFTSSDALPLSYRRLMGALKLGSWDKHPAYC